jgi:hypothetical protein
MMSLAESTTWIVWGFGEALSYSYVCLGREIPGNLGPLFWCGAYYILSNLYDFVP